MTVAQLIEELKDRPQHEWVYVRLREGGSEIILDRVIGINNRGNATLLTGRGES